jgi:uncharacterized protein (TIGR02996 family)
MHPGLLRAILERPDDDNVRMVYADWLDDHGEAERAEFIRLQITLAGLDESAPRCNRYADQMGCECDDCTRYYTDSERGRWLRRRERELLGDHALDWSSSFMKATDTVAMCVNSENDYFYGDTRLCNAFGKNRSNALRLDGMRCNPLLFALNP